ncbi:MAG: ABC transporter ATP-binding protein [Planctomycetota bacterium]
MADCIEVQRVSKRYGDCLALDAVDMTVPEGKVFALLGENGAGKTTLIKILTGFLKPDWGNASILGLDCQREARLLRHRIGYVADSPPLYEWMTPTEIGWFTSAFYDETFEGVYRKLIEEYQVPFHTKIKSLSKGQRAKVALALATAHDPDLLILDEPTAGLDPIVRRQFLESMVDRTVGGRSVLLSTHHINEVERVADVVAMVHHGRMKLVQPLDVLKERTQIVTATIDDAHAELIPPKAEILSHTLRGRQSRWVVADLAEGWEPEFVAQGGVRNHHTSRPSLEEIFVAVCGQPIVKQEVREEAGPLPEIEEDTLLAIAAASEPNSGR